MAIPPGPIPGYTYTGSPGETMAWLRRTVAAIVDHHYYPPSTWHCSIVFPGGLGVPLLKLHRDVDENHAFDFDTYCRLAWAAEGAKYPLRMLVESPGWDGQTFARTTAEDDAPYGTERAEISAKLVNLLFYGKLLLVSTFTDFTPTDIDERSFPTDSDFDITFSSRFVVNDGILEWQCWERVVLANAELLVDGGDIDGGLPGLIPGTGAGGGSDVSRIVDSLDRIASRDVELSINHGGARVSIGTGEVTE